MTSLTHRALSVCALKSKVSGGLRTTGYYLAALRAAPKRLPKAIPPWGVKYVIAVETVRQNITWPNVHLVESRSSQLGRFLSSLRDSEKISTADPSDESLGYFHCVP